MNLEQLIDQLH